MSTIKLDLSFGMSEKQFIDLYCEAYNFREPTEQPEEIDDPVTRARERHGKKQPTTKPAKPNIPKLKKEFAESIITEILRTHVAGLQRKVSTQAMEDATPNMSVRFSS